MVKRNFIYVTARAVKGLRCSLSGPASAQKHPFWAEPPRIVLPHSEARVIASQKKVAVLIAWPRNAGFYEPNGQK